MTDLEKEINKNKQQEVVFKKEIEDTKNKYANMLLSDIGEKMKNDIGTPPQKIKKNKFKIKLKHFFDTIFGNIRTLDGGFY